jgi:threonine synthase
MARSFVSHLVSAHDGTEFEFGKVYTTHEGRPIWVAYDLAAARRHVDRKSLARQSPDMWRYRALLPVGETVISLGEIMTPLLPLPRLAKDLGVRRLLLKDESSLPTGSFKARGMAVAITMAVGLRLARVAVPTAGNAGGAAAAYAARAGIECHVFVSDKAPVVQRAEAALFGAHVHVVDGGIDACAKALRSAAGRGEWFDLSTLCEPYRLEGKKTMGYEVAEQLGWRVPGAIFYPTGGGTGLIGMWKAFQELRQLEWLEDDRVPRMFACQADGCAPIKAAFDAGTRDALPIADPRTAAAGLRVPSAIGDFLVLDAVRASGGRVLSATDDEMYSWMRRAAALEGISICPESAVALACLEQAVRTQCVDPSETIVLFNTAAAQKYVEAMTTPLGNLAP